MILGDGFLAAGAREAFGDVPFTWVLDHPRLVDRDYTNQRVVISTPVLVGTIATLEATFDATFAYVPENVREAHPEDWTTQARFVIGCRDHAFRRELAAFFSPAVCMTPESAEMTKHALNGFLAMSIGYAMDIADLCVRYDADPEAVAAGMMSDPRIGLGAYLKPISRSIGPNLQREIDNLRRLG